MDNSMNNIIYRGNEAIAAFKWQSDAIDYIENESYAYEEGLTIKTDNGFTIHYIMGEIVK